jgi:hypothetical protein
MDSAAQQAVEEGAVMLTSRARRVEPFPDDRWVSCGDAVCWEASPRDVLARCADENGADENGADENGADENGADELDGAEAPSVHVRPWRYIEQAALSQLYDAIAQQIDGAPLRDEEYWQWLLVRRGFDSILVVTTDPSTEDECSLSSGPIVAYAFQRDSDIVEMMVSPDAPEASVELVRRIAADAIERDDHQVRVFGPSRGGPFAEILNRVLPANENAVQQRSSQLVRVIDDLAFIRTIGEMSTRDQALIDGRLGLRLDDAAMTIEVRDGVLHVTADKTPRPQIHARGRAASALLLGQVDWDRIDDDPNIDATSATASRFAARLFQPIRLWRSTLDDLPPRK